MVITFSQTVLVSGLGSSCSQALLAKLPSQMVGSGRITTSSPAAAEAGAADGDADTDWTSCAGNAEFFPEADEQHLVPGRLEVAIAGRSVRAKGAQHVIVR